jgi:hypothetical protein
MSGFFSALSVFFLFRIIFILTGKISADRFLRSACALIGALTFAFTDSFWFSAVEGEVYALSIFFFTLSFWSILKWESGFGKPANNRWLLFITVITGLGMGVHLLNLLTIPVILIVIGLNLRRSSLIYILFLFLAGCAGLFFIMFAMIPAFLKLLAFLDLQFVNRFNLPLHSGIVTGFIIFF